MKKLILLFISLFAATYAAPALAQETVGESLDWLVVSRPAIAIEEVTNSTPVNQPGKNDSRLSIQTHLKQALKGQPPQDVSFERRWAATGVPGQDDTARPAKGTEYLLFFDDHGAVTNAINLKFPSRKIGVGADPKDVAVATDLSVLKSRDLILETVQKRLVKIAAETPAALSAEKPKRVQVPMESAAWDALYEAGDCILLVPDETPVKNNGQMSVLPVTLEFAGSVYSSECDPLPRKAFQIHSVGLGATQTLSVDCRHNPDPHVMPPTIMVLTFQLTDGLRDKDYDFQWDADPEDPSGQKGRWTDNHMLCEWVARAIQTRVEHQKQFTPPDAPAGTQPLNASWKTECVQNDRWAFVLMFHLSVRSGENNISAVPVPASPSKPASVPATVAPSIVPVPKPSTVAIPKPAVVAPDQ